MGTTKLTRKEILSDDPVHDGIIRLFELVQVNRKKIALAVVVIIVLAIGLWGLLRYLDSRALAAQQQLGKGMDFFAATVSADAADDNPYAKGATPLFKTDEAKYTAAAKEFTAVTESFGAGEAGRTARYYLGMTQLKLGKQDEALKNLESVAFGSGSRTVGFLAKLELANVYADSGDAQKIRKAEDLLADIIKDDRCDLPKEEMALQLSRLLVASGKKDEAIKVLREASEAAPAFGAFSQQLLTEIETLQKGAPAAAPPTPPVTSTPPTPSEDK